MKKTDDEKLPKVYYSQYCKVYRHRSFITSFALFSVVNLRFPSFSLRFQRFLLHRFHYVSFLFCTSFFTSFFFLVMVFISLLSYFLFVIVFSPLSMVFHHSYYRVLFWYYLFIILSFLSL